MNDIALHVGVSVMTVSNVVNGRVDKVGEETRTRVREAIAELGYRVNLQARQLRRGHTGTVALAVPDFAAAYFGELAARLADRLSEAQLRLVVERTQGFAAEELAALESSHLASYDGLFLCLTEGTAEDLESVAPARPVVLMGERTVSPQLDHVGMDNVGGGALATSYLLDRGATRIAVIGGSLEHEPQFASLRTRGWVEAHQARGLTPDPALVLPGYVDMNGGYETTMRALAARPLDAVFAVTDSAAIGAMAAVAQSGLSIPGDVQVVGWDDLQAARFTTPGLTTVNPRSDVLAAEAATLLLRRMEGSREGPAARVVTEATLTVRGTTR